MNCKRCGRTLLPEHSFCPDCGAPVTAESMPAFALNQTPLAPNQIPSVRQSPPNQTPLAPNQMPPVRQSAPNRIPLAALSQQETTLPEPETVLLEQTQTVLLEPQRAAKTAPQGPAVERRSSATIPEKQPKRLWSWILLCAALVLLAAAAAAVVLLWKPWAGTATKTEAGNAQTAEVPPAEASAPIAEASSGGDLGSLAQTKEFDETRYELVIGDYSWMEGFEHAKEKGGYLVRIDDAEELEGLTRWLDAQGMRSVYFRLGGRRDPDGTGYYWVNENNELTGNSLNASTAWCIAEWLPGEPSYYNSINEPESYLELFYKPELGRWVLNDVPDVITYPAAAEQKGYIIEYP